MAGANDIYVCEGQQLAYILPKARSRVMVTWGPKKFDTLLVYGLDKMVDIFADDI